MGARKNFKCKFNPYVIPENRDSVVQSLISQFQGYDADPEVTVTDNGLIITLTTSDELTPFAIKDKLLWNYFIETVSTADTIRSIQILRLPKSGTTKEETEGSVGAYGPKVGPSRNTGVNEILLEGTEDGITRVPAPEYKIDFGDRPGGPPLKGRGEFVVATSRRRNFNSRYADPESDDIPFAQDEEGKPINPEVLSDITRLAFGPGEAGGNFGDPAAVATQHGVDVTKGPKETASVGRPTGQEEADPGTAPVIRFDSWFRNDALTDDSFRTRSKNKSAPLQFAASRTESGGEEVINDENEAGPKPQLGDSSNVEGWSTTASMNFGLNEYYGFEGFDNEL